MRIITESDSTAVAKLEAQLQKFYDECQDYGAFSSVSQHPVLWDNVLRLARETLLRKNSCRVLEVGAGRSGFGARLRAENLGGVTLTSHDITARNQGFLAEQGAVLIGPVTGITEKFDLIFHSYACEHFVRPRATLLHLWECLNESGAMVIQCPRYDRPFQLSPACSHLSWLSRIGLALGLLVRDVRMTFSDHPDFALFSDPAILHQPYARDRDAIHRVKRSDLVRLLGSQARIEDFSLPAGGWKDQIVKRWLTLRVIAQNSGK